MALTLIATAGAADANSFASVADADAYHETHPYAETWENADDEEKAKALITATRLLDLYFEWYGYAVSGVQALGWPRYGALGLTGYPLAIGTVPQGLINATAELARQLLDADRTADAETPELKRLKAESIELEWNIEAAAVLEVLPDAVIAMLLPFGWLRRSRSGAGMVPLRR